jgi:hypothetical protein
MMIKLVKIVLWFIGIVSVLLLAFNLVFWPILKNYTKKNSPEKNISYSAAELELNLFYCSPSKKERNIFGGLVPYNEVWRTGANETTTFKTNKDITIDDQPLPAGKYSIWTIPNENSWKVIFNKQKPSWGVKLSNQKAARISKYDALALDCKVSKSLNIVEDFSISLMQSSPDITIMVFAWDNVVVPLEIKMQ